MTRGTVLGQALQTQSQKRAFEESSYRRALVTSVTDWDTQGIRCELEETGEIIYCSARAAGAMFDLSADDYVWVRKLAAGQRNEWIVAGFCETSGGSFVPPLRPAVATQISELYASDGSPQAVDCDADGNTMVLVSLILSDNDGDSPHLLLVGGSNDDMIDIYLDDDASAGHSDLAIKLADAGGESKLSLIDSGDTEIFHVNSDGMLHLAPSATPASPVEGDVYADADHNLYYYNGSGWDDLTAGGGTSDHGSLDGLGDDDHTQYLLADGSRILSADWDIGDGRKIEADAIWARDGAGLALYDDAGNGIFIEDGGQVGIGTTNPTADLEIAVEVFPELHLTTAAIGAGISGKRSGGSLASPTATPAYNNLLLLMGKAYGNTGFYEAARISLRSGSAQAADDDSPGQILFLTSPDGSATVQERMRIDEDGQVGIGTTNPLGKVDATQSNASGAIPVLYLYQADVDEPFIKFRGQATTGLGNNIVAEAEVSSATRAGWLRIEVQDDGGQIASQDYFVPIYTLS